MCVHILVEVAQFTWRLQCRASPLHKARPFLPLHTSYGVPPGGCAHHRCEVFTSLVQGKEMFYCARIIHTTHERGGVPSCRHYRNTRNLTLFSQLLVFLSSVQREREGGNFGVIVMIAVSTLECAVYCFLCNTRADVKFLPCHHMSMCHKCFRGAKRCPTCKVSVMIVQQQVLTFVD